MARVMVPLAQYQEGSLPPVCMISGISTDDVFVLRTGIRRQQEGRGIPAGPLRALESLVERVDVRRPQDLLLGRIPVAREVYRRLRRVRVVTGWVAAVSLVVLTAVAWVGAAWSPLVAVVAAIAAGFSFLRRRAVRRTFPRPTLTHGGTLVVVENVHDAFAAAVAERG